MISNSDTLFVRSSIIALCLAQLGQVLNSGVSDQLKQSVVLLTLLLN